MDLVEKLWALEQIRTVKARYCRFLDTKQWDNLRALFTVDARFDGFGSAPDGSTIDAWMNGIKDRLKDPITVHHCHTSEITFLSDDRARASWAMHDVLEWPAARQLKEVAESRGFVGFGHYEEEYRRENGEWKLSFIRLTRMRLDPFVPTGPFPNIATLRPITLDWHKVQ